MSRGSHAGIGVAHYWNTHQELDAPLIHPSNEKEFRMLEPPQTTQRTCFPPWLDTSSINFKDTNTSRKSSLVHLRMNLLVARMVTNNYRLAMLRRPICAIDDGGIWRCEWRAGINFDGQTYVSQQDWIQSHFQGWSFNKENFLIFWLWYTLKPKS